MDISVILAYVFPVLEVLAQIAIAAVVLVVCFYVSKLLKERDIDITCSEIVDVQIIVEQVVKYLNQTVVDAIKEDTGKLTEDQIKSLQSESLDMVLKFLDSKTVDTLTEKYGTKYIDYLKVLIENSVVDLKK